jgi:hypothetical protein
MGWRRGWPDWHGWPAFPTVGYATVYSGRAVANLEGTHGERMRCRFFLNHPDQGMIAGGQGECELSSGQRISATFPRGRAVSGG